MASFSAGDFVFIGLYFVVTFGIGLFFGKRAGSGLSEYFLSGRGVPWWIAGTGMVATTFAADTPLWVTGQVAQFGVAGNWLWWSMAAGAMLTVFFFARLWRRAGVLTDLELIQIRYSGPLVPWLRGFKSIYFGLFLNAIIISWVNLAMLKVFEVFVGPGSLAVWLLLGCAIVTAAYVSFAGLWGVATADAFQFFIAMGGALWLAIVAAGHDPVVAAGGLTSALPAHTTSPMPDMSTFLGLGQSDGDTGGLFRLPLLSFLVFMGVQWWSAWYPGAEPGGGGYIAQRIMSARDEKHGVLATLWFVTANYCLRSWPWIIAALSALVIFPDLAMGKREESYVMLVTELMPSPMLGLMLAAFIGAYMSTLSTQLNWGASYLINDLYKPYMRPDETETHYVGLSRAITVALLAFSLLVTFFVLDTVSGAWQFLIEFGAGTGFVLILRWYWWRLNAASELAAMISSAAAVLVIRLGIPFVFGENSALNILGEFPFSILAITIVSIRFTLLAAYFAQPTEESVLRAFYKQTRPDGPGWNRVRRELGENPEGFRELGFKTLGWLAGTGFVYAVLFGVGALILGPASRAVWLTVAAAICGAVLYFVLRRDFSRES